MEFELYVSKRVINNKHFKIVNISVLPINKTNNFIDTTRLYPSDNHYF